MSRRLLGTLTTIVFALMLSGPGLSSPSNFIRFVQPAPGATTRNPVIKVAFSRDMNLSSITDQTVSVVSEKQSRDVTDAFVFRYQPDDRILTMQPKNPLFDFGTGNVVTVTLKGALMDRAGTPMGKDFTWRFFT